MFQILNELFDISNSVTSLIFWVRSHSSLISVLLLINAGRLKMNLRSPQRFMRDSRCLRIFRDFFLSAQQALWLVLDFGLFLLSSKFLLRIIRSKITWASPRIIGLLLFFSVARIVAEKLMLVKVVFFASKKALNSFKLVMIGNSFLIKLLEDLLLGLADTLDLVVFYHGLI